MATKTKPWKFDPRGAKCAACKQHMLVEDGCTIRLLVLKDGTRVEPANTKAAGIPARGAVTTAELEQFTIREVRRGGTFLSPRRLSRLVLPDQRSRRAGVRRFDETRARDPHDAAEGRLVK